MSKCSSEARELQPQNTQVEPDDPNSISLVIAATFLPHTRHYITTVKRSNNKKLSF